MIQPVQGAAARPHQRELTNCEIFMSALGVTAFAVALFAGISAFKPEMAQKFFGSVKMAAMMAGISGVSSLAILYLSLHGRDDLAQWQAHRQQ